MTTSTCRSPPRRTPRVWPPRRRQHRSGRGKESARDSRATRYAGHTVDSNHPRCHQSSRSLDPPTSADFLARAIDTSTHPLRTARQVIEEFEEITFWLKRTHRITVEAEEDTARHLLPICFGPFVRRMRQQRPQWKHCCGPSSFGASSVNGARGRPVVDFRKSGNPAQIGRT